MGILGTKYALLGVVAIASILGTYAITTTTMAPTTYSTVTNSENMPYLVGHVTLVVADSDGNIKNYQQTDNLVTNQGLECALDVIFDVTGGCDSLGDFNHIALANNGTANDVSKTDQDSSFTVEVARSQAADTVTIAGFVVTITELFDVGDDDSGLDAGETVDRTGLFDSGTPGTAEMIAHADLSSTTVTAGDEITITWIITGNNPLPPGP